MPLRQDDDLDLRVDDSDETPQQGSRAGATVQLGADYFSYARERYSAARFKDALVSRLLPTVPMRGRPHAIRPGESFGKFQILDRLGKGGMAEVYQALDPERDPGGGVGRKVERQSVAVKVMKPDIALNPEFVGRFLREAANTALIDHPNVVNVLEVGSVAGRLYFTMELIEGMTLKEHLREHDLTEPEGVQILCQMVDGLVAAHECGIGHRDLKPANLMLTTSKSSFGLDLKDEFDVLVKITDFGLAHQIDLDKSDLVRGGRFLGTAKYVAPEVVMGQKATLKSDVFSLGIMAFSMFAGRSPFPARNKNEYIVANIQLEAPLLDTMSNVSHDLALLVDAMLCKDPAQRPGAEAVRRDLSRLRARRDENQVVRVSDDSTSVFQRAGGRRKTAPSAASPPPLGVIAGAGIGLLIVIVALVIAFGGGDEVRPPDPLPDPGVENPDRDDPRDDDPPATSPDDEPEAYSGDPLLAPFEVDRRSFVDQLAKIEFLKLVERGDDAWRDGDKPTALAQWTSASGRLKRTLAPLRRRVVAAERDVALEKGMEAEEQGELARALMHYERALQLGIADDELRERATALEARIEETREFKRRLRRARVLAGSASTRDQAVAELRELLDLAKRLGIRDQVDAELKELGAEPGSPPAPETPKLGPPTEEPSLSEDDLRLLSKADTLIREGAYDAAALGIRRVVDRVGETAQARMLLKRLERGRATPDDMSLVEAPASDGHLPAALYVDRRPISNEDYQRWFDVVRQERLVVPPKGWRGKSAPPRGTEREAVSGVRAADARAFAASKGKRLATPEDLERLGADLKVELPDDDTYPVGFRLVEDVR